MAGEDVPSVRQACVAGDVTERKTMQIKADMDYTSGVATEMEGKKTTTEGQGGVTTDNTQNTGRMSDTDCWS